MNDCFGGLIIIRGSTISSFLDHPPGLRIPYCKACFCLLLIQGIRRYILYATVRVSCPAMETPPNRNGYWVETEIPGAPRRSERQGDCAGGNEREEPRASGGLVPRVSSAHTGPFLKTEQQNRVKRRKALLTPYSPKGFTFSGNAIF
jgi:hypothetical protein